MRVVIVLALLFGVAAIVQAQDAGPAEQAGVVEPVMKIHLADGLVTVEARDADIEALISTIVEITKTTLEIRAIPTGKVTVSFARETPERGIALVLEASGLVRLPGGTPRPATASLPLSPPPPPELMPVLLPPPSPPPPAIPEPVPEPAVPEPVPSPLPPEPTPVAAPALPPGPGMEVAPPPRPAPAPSLRRDDAKADARAVASLSPAPEDLPPITSVEATPEAVRGFLQRRYGGTWHVFWDARHSRPESVLGDIAAPSPRLTVAEGKAILDATAREIAPLFGLTADSLRPFPEREDTVSIRRNYGQVVAGIDVEGGRVGAELRKETRNGRRAVVLGSTAHPEAAAQSTVPAISAKDAVRAARERAFNESGEVPAETSDPRLVIYPEKEGPARPGEYRYRLVWKIECGPRLYYIDAHSGEIVLSRVVTGGG